MNTAADWDRMTEPCCGPEFDAAVAAFWAKAPVTRRVGEHSGRLSVSGAAEMTLEYEPTEAAPRGLPLYITHQRAGGLSELVAAAESVGEVVERATLGLRDGNLGLLNFPERATATRREVYSMCNLLWERRFHGPYLLVHNESRFVGQPQKVYNGHLREYWVDDVRSEHLPPGKRVLLCATPDVARVVEGLSPRTVRDGDHYKFLTITALHLRVDHLGHCGLVESV